MRRSGVIRRVSDGAAFPVPLKPLVQVRPGLCRPSKALVGALRLVAIEVQLERGDAWVVLETDLFVIHGG
jgi:hypothetical protein